MNLNKEISLPKIAEVLRIFIFSLDLYKEKINNLNVFPVPDGDTGTNMFLTLKNLNLDINSQKDIKSFLLELKHSSLMEARGNSGVILSQFFLGLLNSFEQTKVLSISAIANAFTIAADNTRKSLPNPVDGTMLTVYEDIGLLATKSIDKCNSIQDLLKVIAEASISSVKNTPNKLRILRDAGVVDSGGLGLAIMMNAWYFSEINLNIEENLNSVYLEMIEGLSDKVSQEFLKDSGELEWGHCTVFAIIGKNMDIDIEREKLSKFGKSAVITGDSNLIKVHIHVLDINEILNYSKALGEVKNLFVQNMDDQTKDFSDLGKDYKKIETSIISICDGKGIIDSFNESGSDSMHIIRGGGGNNPSLKEIVDQIEKIESENIIILPNNPNIITTVKQLNNLNLDKNIKIVNTKSIQQGIAAIFSFDPKKNFEENINNMKEALNLMEEAYITIATRDVVIDNKSIIKNKFFTVLNDEIFDYYDKSDVALKQIVHEMFKRKDLITIFVGHDSVLKNYLNLEKELLDTEEDKELIIVDGNQSYYNYLLLAE
jgi:DAK2 domain fusion protein YloV|tara:strand:+ start:4464 stop:6095 length:1632 start_codon:yes stop_codon:yes gene_type:complete